MTRNNDLILLIGGAALGAALCLGYLALHVWQRRRGV
jgi:hypothetical protein